MIFVITSGFGDKYVIDMDILSFRSLHEGCTRDYARKRKEEAWTAMIAAQAQQKTMDKWLKRFDQVLESRQKGAAEFLARYGGGI